jgi:hypothetical protein
MSLLIRSTLGFTGAVMLLHAGYSAFEFLTYEKSLDPTSQLEIPLDVRYRLFKLTRPDKTGDRGIGCAALRCRGPRCCRDEACEMAGMDEFAGT